MDGDDGALDDGALQEIERQFTVLGQRIDQIRHLAAVHSGLGLEKAAYRVLARLVDHGPQRATSIAACFGLDESTVSRQVDALVAAGLVERERDPADRRAYLLSPTPRGRRHLAETRSGRRAFLTEVLAQWRSEDRAAFARDLGRFNADLERVTSRRYTTGRRGEGRPMGQANAEAGKET